MQHCAARTVILPVIARRYLARLHGVRGYLAISCGVCLAIVVALYRQQCGTADELKVAMK